ncbi:MAG: sensor histidine kinase [Tepidisphaeraceae bacterium]
MSRSANSAAVRYTVAVASAGAAFLLAITIEHPWVTLSPFFLFYAAVAFSSWYGGTGPGLLAMLLGAIAVDYYLLAPYASLRIEHPRDIARLILFTLVGALIAALNGALRRAQRRYEIEAMAARKGEADVQLHRERLQEMAAELMLAEERERRRIATVLHDAVVQTLALSKLKVDGLRRATHGNGMHERLTEVYELIDKSISHTRTLTADLSPPVLYELGLPAAIQWLGDRLRADHEISFELDAPKEWQPVNEETRIVLFQAVRELLINVAKHAHASKCRVNLSRTDGAITVTVEDNGRGFTPTASTDYGAGGLGLFSIRQRLEHLGGRFDLITRPGGGTTVTLVAPLGATPPAHARERTATT